MYEVLVSFILVILKDKLISLYDQEKNKRKKFLKLLDIFNLKTKYLF